MDIRPFVRTDGTLVRFTIDGARLHFTDLPGEPCCHACAEILLEEYGLDDPVMSLGGAAVLRHGDPLRCFECGEDIKPDTFANPTLPLPFAA